MLRINCKIKAKIKENKKYIESKINLKAKTMKSLQRYIKRPAGRSTMTGRKLLPGRCKGAKRKYIIISFNREIQNIEGEIVSLERDPNRNAFIALVKYEKIKKYEYILATENMVIGYKIIASRNKIVDLKEGNATNLVNLPAGTMIHNLEMQPNSRGKIIRAAGTSGQIVGFDEGNKYAIIKLPSKEIRKFNINCMATIGSVSNCNFKNTFLRKASDSLFRGIRPQSRGVAKNACDHPHGGGEGKGGTRKSPANFKGTLAKGGKTSSGRNKKFLIKNRKT